MKRLLCIDPGTKVSGVVILESESRAPVVSHSAIDNAKLLSLIEGEYRELCDRMVYEKLFRAGMSGPTDFETSEWTGIFRHAFDPRLLKTHPIKRHEVKKYLGLKQWKGDADVRRLIFHPGIEDPDFQPTLNSFVDRLHPDDRDRVVSLRQARIDDGGDFE